jgi:hypothetical protein
MIKSRFFTASILALAAIVIVGGAHKPANVQSSSESPGQSPGRVAQLPEHVPYLVLFHHLSYVKKQGDKLQSQGRDGSGFRKRFVKQFALDEDEFDQMSEIAAETESAVAEIDKKAQVIIDNFRKRFPDGQLPPGVVPPPPPAELLALQQERDGTILRGRDRLKAKLGEREFRRVDEIVKIHLSKSINQMDQK